MNYLYTALAVILGLVILKFILKLSIKIFTTIFVILAIVITATIVVIQPKMHKEFNFNVIEKVLKINQDGSATMIQTTTTTQRKKGK